MNLGMPMLMGVVGWIGHAWYAGAGEATDMRARFVHDAVVAHAV